jgi:hypothetical protein
MSVLERSKTGNEIARSQIAGFGKPFTRWFTLARFKTHFHLRTAINAVSRVAILPHATQINDGNDKGKSRA